MASLRLAQRIAFYPFDDRSLVDRLRLRKQTPYGPSPFNQLNYIESYLRKLGCKCLVLEQHYVDRDHMEDHSVFYSRNLFSPSNYCQRVHFFNTFPEQVQNGLTNLLRMAATSSDNFKRECLTFSREHYQGFSVIRPLIGSPVGRTVLVCFPPDADDGAIRRFDCARDYSAHLMGVELRVHGLAFQQQDVGVSACATTALWSALSKVRDFEDIGTATPAQITTFASRHSLPYGRAMPSEGLSTDQMCQAVQAVGVAPELLRVFPRGRNSHLAALARAYLFSTTASGVAPVLILQRGVDSVHAVTVVGMRLLDSHHPTFPHDVHHRAGDLQAVYVHDDRVGPGVRADIVTRNRELSLRLRIFYESGKRPKYESWKLRYILVPLHHKIRFSFAGLRDVELDVVAQVIAARVLFPKRSSNETLGVENWILRSTDYVNRLLTEGMAELSHVRFLCKRVPLSRYVGVVRVTAKAGMDPIDVVVDTTSTRRNPNIIGVFPLSLKKSQTRFLSELIASRLNCRVIFPRVRAPRAGAVHQQGSNPPELPSPASNHSQ